MNIQMLYVIMIFSASLGLSAGSISKSISIDYIEENVNNIMFTYRCDVIDGAVEEVWTVEGKETNKNDYEKKILEQELEERRRERAREYESRMQKIEFKQAASRVIYQKLLFEIQCQLQELITKFHKYDLMPFVVFSEDTIVSAKMFDRLENKEIKKIKKFVVDSKIDVVKLKKVYEGFLDYPERLTQCLYQTVEHAIGTVDDTKQLKGLLLLISQNP